MSARVAYELTPAASGDFDLKLKIDPGRAVRVSRVEFTGDLEQLQREHLLRFIDVNARVGSMMSDVEARAQALLAVVRSDVKPAPNATNTRWSPTWTRPLDTASDKAIGMDAADVFP